MKIGKYEYRIVKVKSGQYRIQVRLHLPSSDPWNFGNFSAYKHLEEALAFLCHCYLANLSEKEPEEKEDHNEKDFNTIEKIYCWVTEEPTNGSERLPL